MIAPEQPKVQPKLPGPEPERWTRTPAAYAAALHGDGLGTVSIGRKNPRTGAVYQRRLPVERGLQYAKRLRGSTDVYISMNRFGAGLGTSNLISLSSIYADLDYYNNSHRARVDPQAHPYGVVELALDKLREEGIPAPTHAIASGRGVQLVWQFHPVRPDALPRWRRAARRVSEVLREFGADAAVGSDPARVLRLPGTTNSANGGQVEPLLPVGPVYDFGPLCDRILPRTRAELYDLDKEREKRRERGEVAPHGPASPPAGYGSGTLAEATLRDLHRHRGHRGGRAMSDGRRMFLHHYAAAAAWTTASGEELRQECYRMAAEVAGWSEHKTDTALGTVFRKAEAAHRGETIEYAGRQVDPRYRYSTERIIDDLHITPVEQREMERLIENEERRRRRRRKAEDRRRRAGAESREFYEGRASQRREEARRLAAEGYTRNQIAEALGISLRHVYRLLRESEPPEPPRGEAPEDPPEEGGDKSVPVYAPLGGRAEQGGALSTEDRPGSEVAVRTELRKDAVPPSLDTHPLEGAGTIEVLVTQRYKEVCPPEFSGNGEHGQDLLLAARSRTRPAGNEASSKEARAGRVSPLQSAAGECREPAVAPKKPVGTPIPGQIRITQPRGLLERPAAEPERGAVPPGPRTPCERAGAGPSHRWPRGREVLP